MTHQFDGHSLASEYFLKIVIETVFLVSLIHSDNRNLCWSSDAQQINHIHQLVEQQHEAYICY